MKLYDDMQTIQHVLDSSAPNLEEQRQAVLDVLQQIGVSDKKIQDMIEVWNKVFPSLNMPTIILRFFFLLFEI